MRLYLNIDHVATVRNARGGRQPDPVRAALLAAPLSAEAADLLSIAQIAYDAGEMDLVALLDAADALRDAQTLEARFRADFWTSYFDLERALGGFDAAMDRGDDE